MARLMVTRALRQPSFWIVSFIISACMAYCFITHGYAMGYEDVLVTAGSRGAPSVGRDDVITITGASFTSVTNGVTMVSGTAWFWILMPFVTVLPQLQDRESGFDTMLRCMGYSDVIVRASALASSVALSILCWAVVLLPLAICALIISRGTLTSEHAAVLARVSSDIIYAPDEYARYLRDAFISLLNVVLCCCVTYMVGSFTRRARTSIAVSLLFGVASLAGMLPQVVSIALSMLSTVSHAFADRLYAVLTVLIDVLSVSGIGGLSYGSAGVVQTVPNAFARAMLVTMPILACASSVVGVFVHPGRPLRRRHG